MSALELRYCRALVAVVDHGGTTRAARALGISQSTVSEAILALERVLGSALVVRDEHGAKRHLTAAGEAFLPHAREMLASADAALAAVRAVTAVAGARSTLTIGSAESLSTFLLPLVLPDFSERWPGVAVEVRIGLCEALREGVATAQLDIALLLESGDVPRADAPRHDVGRRSTEDLILHTAEPVLIARPTHPLVGKRPDPTAFDQSVVFVSEATGSFQALLTDYFDRAKLSLDVRVVGSVDAVKRSVATARNHAIGFTSLHAVTEELRDGSLVVLHPARAFAPLYVKAVMPSAAADPAITSLIDGLRAVSLFRK